MRFIGFIDHIGGRTLPNIDLAGQGISHAKDSVIRGICSSVN